MGFLVFGGGVYKEWTGWRGGCGMSVTFGFVTSITSFWRPRFESKRLQGSRRLFVLKMALPSVMDIDFYTARTPNGFKVAILLEELNAEYKIHALNLGANDQKKESFLGVNPNGRIPAITVQENGKKTSIFESGSVLMYLARRAGGKFFGYGVLEKETEIMNWLMFQMSGIGPMFGQYFWFTRYAPEKVELAIERYLNESKRLMGILDRHLEGKEYLAAGEYTIADIATFPWVKIHPTLDDFRNVKAYVERIGKRPAVVKGLKVPPEVKK